MNLPSLKTLTILPFLLLVLSCNTGSSDDKNEPAYPSNSSVISNYDQLVTFFMDWRQFRAPEMIDGVPDYSSDAMEKQQQALKKWQDELNAVDTSGWPIKQQVDWYLVLAEMNGLDFAHRVKKPWSRDPAFYVWFYPNQSDVPEREGPNIHGCIEMPDYSWPLSDEEATEIAQRLRNGPAVMEQAKTNLTGDARDLWITGARSIREQSVALEAFAEKTKDDHPDLAAAAIELRDASNAFANWLDNQAPSKTSSSGVGKDNYTWNLKNVHLLPYSWEEEKLLMERELARSHSALRFFEHRNRKLPKLNKFDNAQDLELAQQTAVTEFMNFLEKEEVLTLKNYMDPALREQLGSYSPNDGIRGFFSEIGYRDAIVMRTHHYHWIELARMKEEPNGSPIRKIPLRYNIFDGRAEGLATAMEELMMNAGLLENRPRAKELIWILLAQRAARGLGGLYQHGLEMNLEEACAYASKWTPWGLLPADGGTIKHEEQFYLRQPAYGTSYVIGKLEIDKLIAEYARQRNGVFVLKDFMDELNQVGVIPVSLVYWQMTGDKSMLEAALTPKY